MSVGNPILVILQVQASALRAVCLNMARGKNGCTHLLPAFMLALSNSTALLCLRDRSLTLKPDCVVLKLRIWAGKFIES